MKSKTWERLLACVLALVMVVGMLPISALAAWVDDVPLAAAPAGEEVQVAAPEKTPTQDADLTAVQTAAFDLPGYTMATAEGSALPTGEDNQYLIVAWVNGAAYAFYPNSAGMGTACGNTFVAAQSSNLTAKLSVSDSTLVATNHAGTDGIDLGDLHFTLSGKGNNTYGISGGGYNLTLNTTAMGVTGAGSNFTITKQSDGRYEIKTTDRYLEFLQAKDSRYCDNFWGSAANTRPQDVATWIVTNGLYFILRIPRWWTPTPARSLSTISPPKGWCSIT